MTSFKQTSQQYHAHKQLLQLLTHSISSDQQLLKLLQGLKNYAEAIEDAQIPDDKYSAFINNLDYTVDQKELDRAVAKAKADDWEKAKQLLMGSRYEDTFDRPPYT